MRKRRKGEEESKETRSTEKTHVFWDDQRREGGEEGTTRRSGPPVTPTKLTFAAGVYSLTTLGNDCHVTGPDEGEPMIPLTMRELSIHRGRDDSSTTPAQGERCPVSL